ncbi:MAG: SctK family type III secretion system sorting platform protein [Pseudomonadota bacterium]
MAFNLAPVAELDGSWLGTPPDDHSGEPLPTEPAFAAIASTVAALAARPAIRGGISRHLLSSAGLDETFWLRFPPRARLALVERATLQETCLYAGLVIRSGDIRGALDGRTVKRLRARLGEEAVNFAIRTAPLLGAAPVVDYTPQLIDPRNRLMMVGVFHAFGPGLLAEPAFARRLAFRLPRALAPEIAGLAVAPLPTASAGAEGEALPPMIRRLIREFAPRWLPFFT